MLYNWLRKDIREAEPYSQLARIYDFVMRHVDYERWADYLQRIFAKLDFSPGMILDIGCGTGNLMAALMRKGYSVCGFDISLAMVAIARQKLEMKNIPLWRGDMRHLAVRSGLQCVICLYDSINYLLQLEEVAETIRQVYQVVEQNGVFIFDICTERNSMENFANYFEQEKQGDLSYMRRSHYDHKARIQYTEFDISFKKEKVTFHEVHRQRIYPTEEILALIEQSPWNLLYAFSNFSFEPANKKSNRIHFVLQKLRP